MPKQTQTTPENVLKNTLLCILENQLVLLWEVHFGRTGEPQDDRNFETRIHETRALRDTLKEIQP